jgi:acetyl esterase/lipase
MAIDTYRGMDRDALAVAYDNRAIVPGWENYLANWSDRSQALYASRNPLRDVHYGPGPRQRIDLFEAGDPSAPTVLFMHGGYWQWNDKEGQAFIAEGMLPHGLSVAIGEHTLAPGASMNAICDEPRAMVARLRALLAERGRRDDAIVVCGISSGAHLMACALAAPGVRGAVLISGTYDLEPIRISPLNTAIGMDAQTARQCSPLHAVHTGVGEVLLSHGSRERPEIVRQSADFYEALIARGHKATLAPVVDADHFSVLETLANPSGVLALQTLALTRRVCA